MKTLNSVIDHIARDLLPVEEDDMIVLIMFVDETPIKVVQIFISQRHQLLKMLMLVKYLLLTMMLLYLHV